MPYRITKMCPTHRPQIWDYFCATVKAVATGKGKGKLVSLLYLQLDFYLNEIEKTKNIYFLKILFIYLI